LQNGSVPPIRKLFFTKLENNLILEEVDAKDKKEKQGINAKDKIP